MTPAAMLAASHLLGVNAVALHNRTDGEPDLRDPYGTPISYYMRELGHPFLPFEPEARSSTRQP